MIRDWTAEVAARLRRFGFGLKDAISQIIGVLVPRSASRITAGTKDGKMENKFYTSPYA